MLLQERRVKLKGTAMTSADDDEEFMDDPIKLIDFEQKRILGSHHGNMNEEFVQVDPDGDLFIENVNKSESFVKRKPSLPYNGSTVTLPVSFFDISQNVEYLNVCRPISIKIIDCKKHPWYYKRYKMADIEQIIDSGVEECIADKGDISKHIDINMSKNKIRPVSTPYSALKTSSPVAKYDKPNEVSRKSENKLKDWQKVIKQKALDSRTHEVDFKKNLGLIGLTITHTNEKLPYQPRKRKAHCSDDVSETGNVKKEFNRKKIKSSKGFSEINDTRDLTDLVKNKRNSEDDNLIHKKSNNITETLKTSSIVNAMKNIPNVSRKSQVNSSDEHSETDFLKKETLSANKIQPQNSLTKVMPSKTTVEQRLLLDDPGQQVLLRTVPPTSDFSYSRVLNTQEKQEFDTERKSSKHFDVVNKQKDSIVSDENNMNPNIVDRVPKKSTNVTETLKTCHVVNVKKSQPSVPNEKKTLVINNVFQGNSFTTQNGIPSDSKGLESIIGVKIKSLPGRETTSFTLTESCPTTISSTATTNKKTVDRIPDKLVSDKEKDIKLHSVPVTMNNSKNAKKEMVKHNKANVKLEVKHKVHEKLKPACHKTRNEQYKEEIKLLHLKKMCDPAESGANTQQFLPKNVSQSSNDTVGGSIISKQYVIYPTSNQLDNVHSANNNIYETCMGDMKTTLYSNENTALNKNPITTKNEMKPKSQEKFQNPQMLPYINSAAKKVIYSRKDRLSQTLSANKNKTQKGLTAVMPAKATVEQRLWLNNPSQQLLQRTVPPTSDVSPPQVLNTQQKLQKNQNILPVLTELRSQNEKQYSSQYQTDSLATPKYLAFTVTKQGIIENQAQSIRASMQLQKTEKPLKNNDTVKSRIPTKAEKNESQTLRKRIKQQAQHVAPSPIVSGSQYVYSLQYPNSNVQQQQENPQLLVKPANPKVQNRSIIKNNMNQPVKNDQQAESKNPGAQNVISILGSRQQPYVSSRHLKNLGEANANGFQIHPPSLHLQKQTNTQNYVNSNIIGSQNKNQYIIHPNQYCNKQYGGNLPRPMTGLQKSTVDQQHKLGQNHLQMRSSTMPRFQNPTQYNTTGHSLLLPSMPESMSLQQINKLQQKYVMTGPTKLHMNIPQQNTGNQIPPENQIAPQQVLFAQGYLQQNVQGPETNQNFTPSIMNTNGNNNAPYQYPSYQHQYQPCNEIDPRHVFLYSPNINCLPQSNPMPYDYSWNYYPNVLAQPVPPHLCSPSYPPVHLQNAVNASTDFNQTACNRQPNPSNSSALGNGVIGRDHNGPIRRINIISNSNQDENKEQCTEKGDRPTDQKQNIDSPISSKAEMLEELGKINASISSPNKQVVDNALKADISKLGLKDKNLGDQANIMSYVENKFQDAVKQNNFTSMNNLNESENENNNQSICNKNSGPSPLFEKPKLESILNIKKESPVRKGYSPPILPILSYTELTLELMGKSGTCEADSVTKNENRNGKQCNNLVESELLAKTKATKESKREKELRKITLEDYKKRVQTTNDKRLEDFDPDSEGDVEIMI